jgi:hypothetical protein
MDEIPETLARALLLMVTMKSRDVSDSKRITAMPRLPKGVILRAANRVGLTRQSLLTVAGLAVAGFAADLDPH